MDKDYNKIYRDKYKQYGLGAGTIWRYGFKLSLEVYERANRKCQKCGEVNDLTIHHLDGNGRNNAENGLSVNNEIDNLILICRRCHGSIHGKEHGKEYRKKKGGAIRNASIAPGIGSISVPK